MNTRKSVLLVDDDVDVLAVIRPAVEKDYEVRTARSGQECIAAVAALRPDCIVLDVIMDNLGDGLETARTLKESAATKSIPIIMLTSVNESYDFRAQVGQGYYPNDKWLDKPVKPEVLVKEIKALIG